MQLLSKKAKLLYKLQIMIEITKLHFIQLLTQQKIYLQKV